MDRIDEIGRIRKECCFDLIRRGVQFIKGHRVNSRGHGMQKTTALAGIRGQQYPANLFDRFYTFSKPARVHDIKEATGETTKPQFDKK